MPIKCSKQSAECTHRYALKTSDRRNEIIRRRNLCFSLQLFAFHCRRLPLHSIRLPSRKVLVSSCSQPNYPATQDSICEGASPRHGSYRCKQPEQSFPYQITQYKFSRILSAFNEPSPDAGFLTYSFLWGFDDKSACLPIYDKRLNGSYAVRGQTDPTVRIGFLYLVPLCRLYLLSQSEYQASPLLYVSLTIRGCPG